MAAANGRSGSWTRRLWLWACAIALVLMACSDRAPDSHEAESIGTQSQAVETADPAGTPGTSCGGYVEQLASGAMRYAVKFAQPQAYVEVFVRQNGTQNIAENIVGSAVANGDGTFTYSLVKQASQYHAGDSIQARFYSYRPSRPGVFTPGPAETVWLPTFTYGQVTCPSTAPACHQYITVLANGDLRFSVKLPSGQQYVEVFVQQNGVQNVAQNIVASGASNGDGTSTYSIVEPASHYHAGDVILTRFYSYLPSSPGVFTPGPLEQIWAPELVIGTSCQQPAGGSCSNNDGCQHGLTCVVATCRDCSAGGCDGSACSASTSCAPGLTCVSGTCRTPCGSPPTPGCIAPHCTNNTKDADETDVDCGGSCGPCQAGKQCTTDASCAAGLACSSGLRCVSFCDVHPDAAQCTCSAVCATKSCGADPATSCGNDCSGYCPNGQGGCQSDIECAAGSVCGHGIGTRFGYAADVNVCWPAACATQAPQLGQAPIAGCGTAPACVPNCTGNRLENGCGGYCIDPTALEIRGPGGSTFTQIPMIPRGGTFFPDALPQQTTAAVGALAGSLSVSEQGTASYTIPLEVPPGRLGLQPKLALQYLGTKANGMLGLGWGLSGLSSIARCRSTKAQVPHALRPVMLDDQDRFCLDGEMLIQVNVASGAAYGGDGAQYVLEKDTTRLRLTSHSEGGVTTGYFTALARDGGTLSFGRNDAAVVASNGVRRVWALEDVQDSAQNFMTVRYLRVRTVGVPHGFGIPNVAEADTGELLPRLISYGGSRVSAGSAAARDATRFVSFSYEQRPDPVHHYTAGDLGFSNWRIKAIETSVNGTVVKTYRIGYEAPADQPIIVKGSTNAADPNAIHSASKVHSVTECAPDPAASGNEVCKPATAFSYYAETLQQSHALPTITYDTEGGTSIVDEALTVITLDANGDGKDDLAFPTVAGVKHFELSAWGGGDPAFADVKVATDSNSTFAATISSGSAGTHFDQNSVVDLNRDGKDDLIPLGLQEPFRVFYSDSTATEVHWRSELLPIPWDGVSWMLKLGDFDGDGLKDLVTARIDVPGVQLSIYRNTGTTFASQPTETFHVAGVASGGQAPETAVFDYDGDGDDDLLHFGFGTPLSVWDSASQTWKTLSDEVPAGAAVGDFNGDGLKDFMWPNNLDESAAPNNSIRLWYNTGKGFKKELVSLANPNGDPSSIRPWLPTLVSDVDGDGADDLLVKTSSGNGRAVIRLVDRARAQVTFDPVGFPAFNVKEIATAADLDGDGSQEVIFLQQDTGALSFASPGAGVADLLKSVQDGLGRRDTVEYAAEALHLHSNVPTRTYKPDGCIGGSLNCLHHVAPLVSSQTAAQVDPATQEIKFGVETLLTYDGAVIESGGHGWFGFSHRNFDVVGLSTTTIDYHTDEYLLAGLPLKREIIHSNDGSPYSTIGTRRDVTEYGWVSFFNQSSNDPDLPRFAYLAVKTDTRFSSEAFYSREETLFGTDEYNNTTFADTIVLTPTTLVSHTTTNTPRLNDVYGHKIGLLDYVEVESQRGGDDLTRKTKFEYDARGLLTAASRQPDDSSSSAYQRTVLTPNDFGVVDSRCVITSDGVEQQRCSMIDLDDWSIYPTAVTEVGESLTTEYTFGAEAGQVLVQVEPSGARSELAYDAFGRTSYVHGPKRQGPIGYAAASPQGTDFASIKMWGALTVASQFAGEAFSSTTYDALGHPVQSRTTGLDDTLVVSEALYDELGRVSLASLPHATGSTNQGVRQYDYDANGSLQAVTEPDNSVTRIEAIDSHNVQSTWSRWFQDTDAVEASVVQLPRGNRKVYVRDHMGNVVRTFDDPAELGGRELTTRFDYSAFDVLRDVTTAKDRTHFDTDIVGRTIGVTSPTTGTRTRAYSGFDDLAYEADANADTVNYQYDGVGRIVRELDAGDNTIAKWEYDDALGAGVGQPFRAFRRSSPSSTQGTWTEYEYESGTRARLLATTERVGADLDTPQGGELFRTSLTYKTNAPGVVDTISYPSNGGAFKVQHDYDLGGNLRAVMPDGDTGTHAYWRLVAADQGLRAKDEVFGNGVETTRAYHYLGDGDVGCALDPTLSCAPGLPVSITTAKPNTSALQTIGLATDRNGNVRALAENVQGLGARTFTYDGLDRLVGEKVSSAGGPMVVKNYDYDDVGNLRYQSDATSSAEFVYNLTTGRLDSFRDNEYEYDGNGNQVERVGSLVAGTRQHLDLNELELPWHISQGQDGAEHDTFLEYTADQERIVKREGLPVGEKITTSVGGLYERIATPNGTEHHYKIYGGAGQVAEIVRHSSGEAGVITYLHDDHLGSTRLLTDATGTKIEGRDFEPFGKEKSAVDWDATNIKSGFTGHSQDNDLGLVNMKGRLYDPAIGRFISADPFVANPMSALGWDRYAYVENNPLAYIDPSGFEWSFWTESPNGGIFYGVNPGSAAGASGSRQGQGEASGSGHAPASGPSGGAGTPQATGPSGPTGGPSGAGGPAMGQPAIANPGNHPIAQQPTTQPTPSGQSNAAAGPIATPPPLPEDFIGPPVADQPTVPERPPGVSVDKNIQEAEIHRWLFQKNPRALYSWFHEQVKNKGPWDYKQKGRQYQNFGNFNFGATGAAAGIPLRTLLREAGRAQVDAGTSRKGWGYPGWRFNPRGGRAPYGDDPADQSWITGGYRYYHEVYGRRWR